MPEKYLFNVHVCMHVCQVLEVSSSGCLVVNVFVCVDSTSRINLLKAAQQGIALDMKRK